LANLNVRYNNIGGTGLFAALSVYDLLDTYTPFAQPYDGYFGPIPSGGREFTLQLGYQLDYKKSK
jgi:hypothetical protein